MSKQTPEQRAEEIHSELVGLYKEVRDHRNEVFGLPTPSSGPEFWIVTKPSIKSYHDVIEFLHDEISIMKAQAAKGTQDAMIKKMEWIATTMQLKCRKP